MQIATLAASGLTNKAIGERLHLSARIVSGHLYNVFPKLGITARAGLRDALTALTAQEDLPRVQYCARTLTAGEPSVSWS